VQKHVPSDTGNGILTNDCCPPARQCYPHRRQTRKFAKKRPSIHDFSQAFC